MRIIITLEDGRKETFHSEAVANLFLKDNKAIKIEKKEVFGDEERAKKFAGKVGGTVTMKCLPSYMSVETVWVAEWEE